MKQKNYSSKVFAIMCFYVIAIIIRYYLTIGKPGFLLDISNSLFYNILTGIGPFIGSMVAIYILGRKTIYSSFGKSPIKSIACFILPIFFFFLFDIINKDYSFVYTKIVITCLVYSYLEEYGWRGYLQSELINLRKIIRISIITVLWFVWHLNFDLSMGNALFFALLFFGSWGIGQIAIKSHSIIACACFHSVINIMQNINLTTVTLIILVISITLWFMLWYYNWERKWKIQ
ncbi:CPBP family intramembrane glutamic endopeptidase [Phocaeicola faecalis]|uniref:CPBP family intramembrane glutamic endopeptidase n=1 Tax=Phocaeicola faecalis TaxID=2786956 RepID=UPI001F1CA88D|nr:CPBP family intramembrane glutamic endopeptidase [Phocaeicola faecalis]